MTPRETLEKYGLKTDVKSIRERVEKDNYWDIAYAYQKKNRIAYHGIGNIISDIRSADLSLLCELAEKGEMLGKENDELQWELLMSRYDKVQLKQIREIVHEYICKNGDSELSMALNKVLNVFYAFQKGEPR